MSHSKNTCTPEVEDDTFVNVWIGKEGEGGSAVKEDDNFYGRWLNAASAKHSSPAIVGGDALLRLYPKHSLAMTTDYNVNVLALPGVVATPIEKTPLIVNSFFIPLSRSASQVPGILRDTVHFGAFNIAWKNFEFLLFQVQYPLGLGIYFQTFLLHEGSKEPARLLLLSAGTWADELHDEIWVFNQGFWQKNAGLWHEVQKADWKDVILKEEFKKSLQEDVYGFFASKETYEELAIPWKRGLIMYGPPGNGKTISLKTIMKTCGVKGYPPLYVKSFQSYKGEEAAMADVFDKARQVAPCVIILEDLDSLINDNNRSFFLNQVDGLESNDGLLIIGTTNHFERLDPGLSSRPSRFDRKYEFDDPDREERVLYVQYWQKKLASNKEIDFPDKLVYEVADTTKGFSFAYLKEAFVSSLVTFANGKKESRDSFPTILKAQIKVLRKQLDNESNIRAGKRNIFSHERTSSPEDNSGFIRPPRPGPQSERSVRSLLDALSDSVPRMNGMYDSGRNHQDPSPAYTDRDFRRILDALSDAYSYRDINRGIRNRYDQGPNFDAENGGHYRALFDRLSMMERGGGPFVDQLHQPPSQTTSSEGSSKGINNDLGP